MRKAAVIVFILLFFAFVEVVNTVMWVETSSDCNIGQYFVPRSFVTGRGFCANYSSYDVYDNCSKRTVVLNQ